MKISRATYIWVIMFLFPLMASAQIDSLSSLWAEFVGDDPELLQIIQKLYEDPVDINSADHNQLSEIPFLLSSQIDSILSLRKKKGRFRSKRELRQLLGKQLYEQIKPFFTASKNTNHHGYISHRNYAAIVNKSEWSGNLLYDYNKAYYRINKQISLGFITQKDVGEYDLFDYSSGFVEYNQSYWRVIVGKYYLKFGEGLTFFNPFGAHKSAMVINPLKIGSDNGYSSLSSNESGGQFGGYLALNFLGNFKIHLFYSNKKQDVRYNENSEIISIDYSGYHRTNSEINKENRLTETLVGISLTYIVNQNLEISGLLANYQYSPEIEFSKKSVGLHDFRRQYFKFTGSGLTQYAVFYKANFNNIHLGGELSGSDVGAIGFSQTSLLQLNKISFGVKFWRVNRDFQSPGGRIFDSSDPFPKAEEGIYGGLSYTPFTDLSLSFYRIYKKDLWRTYFDVLPGSYFEWLFQSDYRIKKMLFQFRFRQNQHKDYYFAENGYHSQYIKKNEFRIQLELQPYPKLRMKSRWQYSDISLKNERGSIIFQDFRFKLKYNILLNMRITFFRTTSWLSRMYEYESDLPGAFANYPLYGEGRKWYLMVRWNPIKSLYFYLKYRHLYFENMQLNELLFYSSALLKREVRLQLTFKF